MTHCILRYKTLLATPLALALISCGGNGGSNSGGSGGGGPTNSTGTISIAGTSSLGQTLTTSITDGNGTSGSTFVYQWLRAGASISGATSATYSPTNADVGNALSVEVSYTDDDNFSESLTSAATASVTDPTPANSAGSVSISGTAQVGEVLSASVSDTNGLSSSTLSYQWQAGTTDISGASSSDFAVTSAQVGQTLRVMIYYTDDDGYDESLTSASTAIVPTVAVLFAGNFQRGSLGANDSIPDIACDTIYMSSSDLEDNATRTLPAGTTLCLADGDYTGLELVFGGVGTEAMPITVAAENPGGAVISGETSVRMSGEYAVLQGLVFKDGESASSDFLQTRNGSGGDHCNNCRITEIAVIDLASDDSGKWLNIYGQNNRIDHSWFAGKENTGALLIINREIPSGGTAADLLSNNTVIDHNYFGDRPPTDGKAYAESSDNDYEAIRIGTSDGHAFDSNVVVEYNYFERVEGEAEVISNKAGNNIIANNTIRDSYGSLTTRHGESATIEGNFIMGDGHPYAGGLRIIDSDHRVINNYIEGARYLNTRFHGGIVIHNSDGSTSNGYQDVSNVLISHNTVVDSVNSLNVNGGNRSDNPEEIYFANNIIEGAIGPIITYADEGLPASSFFSGNYVEGVDFSDDAGLTSDAGFSQTTITLSKDALGISRPDISNATALAANTAANIGSFAAIDNDMDGQSRPSATQSGADHISTDDVIRGLITADDVGPVNYRPDYSKGYVARIALQNSGFDAVAGWGFTAPAAISTDAAQVFSGPTTEISGAGEVSQTVSVTPGSQYTLTAFSKGPIVLGADIGGTETTQDSSNSDYRLNSVSFNSGAASSIDIFARLDDAVSNSVAIGDPSFDDFTGNSADLNWVVSEQSGVTGQVQTTGNSAFGDSGALKFRLNDGSGEVGGQGVTQLLSDIVPNTDYTLSAYVLNKRDFDVTATIGVYEAASTTVLASQVLDYAALETAGAPESDEDGFLLDSFQFNSGAQTSLTLFVTYTVNTVYADGGTQADTELWVDDISLTFDGAPAAGAKAYVDEFRLVAHGN